MTGSKHRMPRLLTRLTGWLALGLAAGWAWPSAALAAGDEGAGDHLIPPFTASAEPAETGAAPAVQTARAPQITRAETLEDTQSTSGLVITRHPDDGLEVEYFQITGITGGTLYLNDGVTPIHDGQFITAAQAGAGLKFTPTPDANSTLAGDLFTFTVKADVDGEGTGISDGVNARITVLDVNDPPVGAADALAEVAEDGDPLTIPFADLIRNDSAGPPDEAGQTLTILSVGDPVGGTVKIEGTNVIFTLEPDFNGTASFTYTVQDDGTSNGSPDPKESTVPTVVTIPVTPVNDAPTGVDDDLGTLPEDSVATFAAELTLANDIKGPDNESDQELYIIDVDNVLGGTAHVVGGNVLFTPTPNYYGPASFRYTLSDNGTTAGEADHKTSTAHATFEITPVADAPQITPAETSEDTQSTRGLVITRSAADGDEVTHFQVTGITGGTLYLNDGVTPIHEGQFITAAQAGAGLKFTPAPDANTPGGGTFTFTVKGAVDATGTGLGEGTSAEITVSEVNDAPTAVNDILPAIAEDAAPFSVPAADLTANDLPGPANEAGQPLTIVAVGDAVNGTVAISGTDVIFTPDLNFNGIASFTYTLADEGTTNGAPDPQIADAVVTVTIPVTPVNDAPVAEDQSLTASAGTSLKGTLKATDVEDDALTYELVDRPILGNVSINPDGSFTYFSSRAGQDRFTFKAHDGTDDSNVATVTIEVSPRSGGSSRRPAQPAEVTEPATPEPPAGDGETPEGEGGAQPVRQEVEPGQPAEAGMFNFQVSLPGDSIAEPLLLQVLSPTANADAVRLAEGAAEFADTGDIELIRLADGSAVSEVAATITFAYDPEIISDPTALRIFYFDTKQNVWVEIGGVVDTETNTITVQVGHFTAFAALLPRAGAPVLSELPAEVRSERLTVSGAAPVGMPVTLVVNGNAQSTVTTGEDGRYTMEGTLAAGQNWVYVKGTGALASREWPVTYRPAERYADITGHWAEETISRLAELDIATVYPAPLFEPEAKVTRLEFAVMVTRALGLAPADEAPAFTDTASMPEWSWPEVAAAYQAGIIKGMLDGSFAPDRLVSRAEMAVMLARALEYAGKDITPGDHRFADEAEIPDWALDQVHAAARWGLITGYPDGTFRPASDTTRAEAVTMLGRLLDQASE